MASEPTCEGVAATARKVELWQARQFAEERGIYTWMVYDVDSMSCHWYENEVDARNFMAALRQGVAHAR